MYISRIQIQNFRNFAHFEVALAGNIVCVGENRVGKSNLLYALRLLFDPTLPDSARQLSVSDFWDGLGIPAAEAKIKISVDIRDFENDNDILAIMTDYRVNTDPATVRLTFEYRPKADLEKQPSSEDDYEFVCYGGESERKQFGHELRRRLPMDLLAALRDAEGDLGTWRRSPLRPLIEDAFGNVGREELDTIKDAIEAATQRLTGFDEVKELERNLGELFASMSGPQQDVRPRLGFGPTDVTRLYRNIRLLIDDGRRSIGDASLGSANIVFLTLKALELKRQIDQNRRDHTFFAIEEPEAHLHPHLQRTVYKRLFEDFGDTHGPGPLSIILTTHSPHIASIAPLRSLLLLKDIDVLGTVGCSTAEIALADDEAEDLARYLDVTRAEMLFARGIILVEGDAEKFLLPVFAEALGYPLDYHGITVCSVAGTNFSPYVKFLTALGIPHAVITDWDPRPGKKALGFNRVIRLALLVEEAGRSAAPGALREELRKLFEANDAAQLRHRVADYGVFANVHTLEIDLFQGGFGSSIAETLREHTTSTTKLQLINEWEADPGALDPGSYLAMIDAAGKGRFAQRLASRLSGMRPPAYIRQAIEYVASRV